MGPLLSALHWVTSGSFARAVLRAHDMEFNTDVHLPRVPSPVLILHAEDDPKIPVRLAGKLYNSSLAAGKQDVQLHVFPRSLGLGHRYNYKAPGLPALIRSFLATASTTP